MSRSSTLGALVATALLFPAGFSGAEPSTTVGLGGGTPRVLDALTREIPCTEFLAPYFEAADPNGRNATVDAVVVFNSKDGLATYSDGVLRLSQGLLHGSLTKVLSDREYCPEFGPVGIFGPTCMTQDQRFSIKEPAFVEVAVMPTGEVGWIEKSFGNQKFSYVAKCYNNGTAFLPGAQESGVMSLGIQPGLR